MQSLPLRAYASTVLSGTGAGTASTGPLGVGVQWQNVTVTVSCTTNNSEATCRVYVGGGATPQFFADGTTWGSTGDNSDSMPGVITSGQSVFAVWSGGDSGTSAYLVVTGTKQVA